MAGFGSIDVREELRPAVRLLDGARCLVHTLDTDGKGNVAVEFEDGTMALESVRYLRFTDSAGKFEQYGWKEVG